jgi:hypothetical protein
MSGLLSIAASAVLIALAVWMFGGLVLRTGGAALVVAGLLFTAWSGSLTMAAVGLAGALMWLGGHWLFALRHHYFGSPLARRIFNAVLPALNPTRAWGIPNVPPERRR